MSGDRKTLIENAIIFSKETKEILLTHTFKNIKHDSEEFSDSLEEIKKIALKLEKGTFILDFDSGLSTLVYAIPKLSLSLTFNEQLYDKEKNEWISIAKEILEGFEKIYKSESQNYFDYDKKLIEIIEWYLKEKSPVDKMKDALW